MLWKADHFPPWWFLGPAGLKELLSRIKSALHTAAANPVIHLFMAGWVGWLVGAGKLCTEFFDGPAECLSEASGRSVFGNGLGVVFGEA